MVAEAGAEQEALIAEGVAEANAINPQEPSLQGVPEDRRGIVTVRGRAKPLGKLALWGLSVSARCMLHQRCARPYSFSALPPGRPLHAWLLAGLQHTTAASHMGMPKPLASEAQH